MPEGNTHIHIPLNITCVTLLPLLKSSSQAPRFDIWLMSNSLRIASGSGGESVGVASEVGPTLQHHQVHIVQGIFFVELVVRVESLQWEQWTA